MISSILRTIGAMLGCGLATLSAEKHLARSPVIVPHGVVAASHPLASQAGLAVLQRGGNAIDAAVVAAAVMNVVEPMTSGLGGDVFAILWIEKEQRLVGLNASGRFGSLLSAEALRAAGLSKFPDVGPLTITVPGTLSGWAALLERYGTLSLADALEPAAKLAEEGFPLSPITAEFWAAAEKSLTPEARPVFQTKEGRAPRTGEWQANPDFARTLRDIAKHGPGWLYGGELGAKIAAHVRGLGGFITVEDLKAHTVEWVEPMAAAFGDYKLWELPPNGQGIAALEMLRILEAYDLKDMGWGTPRYLHHLIEAKKLAYADLYKFVGDPEYMRPSAKALLTDEFIAARRRQLNPDKAEPRPATGVPLNGDTTYLTTADKDGNMVSFISSLSWFYGSGIVAPGTGFALQNRGSGFTMEPGRPDTAAPGRRPFHTIIPGFITKRGPDGRDRPWVSFGVMGGPNQPQAHVQVMLNLILFGMDAQAALDAPRFRHNGGLKSNFDRRFPAATIDGLKALGHEVEPMPNTPEGAHFGTGHIIRRLERGYEAGCDSRSDGVPAGY